MFPIPAFSILSFSTPVATSIRTDSIGIAIVGGKLPLTYTVTPEDAPIHDITFTSSDDTKMTIDTDGLMTFVAEGGFDATMSAKNASEQTLTDSSGGYASTLGVATASLSTMEVGTTQQLVATISPTGAATLPGMVVTYTTTDATIATVDPTGLITSHLDGDCRIGCTATYQGTVIASDSSYLEVIPLAMDFDMTQTELPAGVTGSGSNIQYYRASGNTLAKGSTVTDAPLEYIGTVAQGRRIAQTTGENRAPYNTTINTATQWTKLNAAVQAFSSPSPAGTNSYVVRVAPDTTSASHSVTSLAYAVPSNLLSGTKYTASAFLKATGLTKVILRIKGNTLTQDVTADLTAGTVSGTGGAILDMGNGWYRVMNHMTLSANQNTLAMSIVPLNASGQEVFVGNGNDGVLLWLPQLEALPFARSPKETTSGVSGYGAVTITFPKNGHVGADIYYSNGLVVRYPFSGSLTTWDLPVPATEQDPAVGDWGTLFVKGVKYYS